MKRLQAKKKLLKTTCASSQVSNLGWLVSTTLFPARVANISVGRLVRRMLPMFSFWRPASSPISAGNDTSWTQP